MFRKNNHSHRVLTTIIGNLVKDWRLWYGSLVAQIERTGDLVFCRRIILLSQSYLTILSFFPFLIQRLTTLQLAQTTDRSSSSIILLVGFIQQIAVSQCPGWEQQPSILYTPENPSLYDRSNNIHPRVQNRLNVALGDNDKKWKNTFPTYKNIVELTWLRHLTKNSATILAVVWKLIKSVITAILVYRRRVETSTSVCDNWGGRLV